MTRISIKEARGNLRKLLDRVSAGEEILLVRRGKPVARISLPPATKPFPDLAKFRASIPIKGEPISKTVVKMREESRY